jgi:hypothetical protein
MALAVAESIFPEGATAALLVAEATSPVPGGAGSFLLHAESTTKMTSTFNDFI